MRIVGGSYRGRRLAAVGKGDAKNALRPTTDRLREALFNVLDGGRYGDPVTGAVVLDLFAGTGALGFEALSRGADHVTFVESGRVGQGLIRENARTLDVTDQTHLIARDATRVGALPGDPATLVFLDPPYGRDLGARALETALKAGSMAQDALVVWEEAAPMDPPPGFALREHRAYGGTVFTFLEVAT